MAIVQRPAEAKVNREHQLDALTEFLAELGWDEGTRVRFSALDDDTIVLLRLPATTPPPEGWTEHFAGKLGGVFGDHDEIMAYLDEERRSWDPEESDGAR